MTQTTKRSVFVAGHTQGYDGTVTVEAVVWLTTLDANRTLQRRVADLEREICWLTREGE